MRRKRSTRSDAIILTGAAIVKSLVQLITPIALVRMLSQTEFGEFRVFWLIANTATLILPLGMARSLLYFMPKSTEEERGRYISQTSVFFLGIATGVAGFLAVGTYWLAEPIVDLTEPEWVLVAFMFLWVASSPVRYVANADQNVVWQAWATIAIALLRGVVVVGTAVYFKDIQAVFLGLLAWCTVQFLILAYYVWSRHGRTMVWPSFSGLGQQVAFAAPFGLSQTLSGARRSVAQWIVVFLFSPAALAVFAIGSSFNAVLKLVRGSLGNVLLPKISKSHAAGDTERAVRLNNRGNVAISVLVTPILCWLWVYAEPVISLMYTNSYVAAVPVLRVYLVMMLVMSIELGSVLMVLKQGRFVLTVSMFVLVGASVLSYAGGQTLGLVGVALGSLIGEIVGRALNFVRVSRELGMSVRHLQDWSTLLRIFAAGFLAIAATQTWDSWIGLSGIPALLAGSVFFAACYAACAALLGLSWLLPILAGRQGWRD